MAATKLSERQELKKQASREMSVYKRDDMIQKARFSLSLREQKCVLYAVSKIKPTDAIFQEYTFDLKDFYSLCGTQNQSYTELKAILQGLKQKTWWIETAPGVESTVSWFNKVRINHKSGKVTIRFDDDMMPFLLKLSGKESFYTGYSLRYVLPMSSQYAPRLYELLKSYQKNNREWFFEIQELKRRLDAEDYDRWPDFRRRVIEPAVEEINRFTDINVAWDTQKEGRKVTRVIFYMANKGQEALWDAQKAGTARLDGQVDMETFLESQTMGTESVKERFQRENPVST